MSQPLLGKSALVMGGSRGIGAAIVRRLARDGASVAFTYAASGARAAALAAEIEREGGRALAIEADGGDPAAVRRAVEEAAEALGGLDILVSNAGILINGSLGDYDLADFDRMVAVNVRAVFVASQAAAPLMRDGGRMITIGSVVAERNGSAGSAVYGMTKAAVAALNRGLARDLGPRGITVNTIQPGPTATDMTPGEGPIADRVRPMIALGRLGRDDEIAGLAAYLAGPESAFVTGASLTIDGGFLA